MGALAGVRYYTDIMASVGVGGRLARVISGLEIAAAVGLVAGVFYPLFGVAAAVGLVALMAGAVGFHVRAKEFKGLPAPASLGMLSVVAAMAGLGAVS